MKKTIPFDIKYRPQIENGEMKVETEGGTPVEILKWDADKNYPIIVCIQGCAYNYTEKGVCVGAKSNLVLVTEEPEPELTEFEEALNHILKVQHASPYTEEEFDAWVKDLLELARKELCAKGELITQEHHQNLMDMMCEKTKKDTEKEIYTKINEKTEEVHKKQSEKLFNSSYIKGVIDGFCANTKDYREGYFKRYKRGKEDTIDNLYKRKDKE